MPRKLPQRLLAFFMILALLLSACADAPEGRDGGLSWVTWGGYDAFWELLGEEEPDIEIGPVGYAGANYTGYSWAQMRSGDLPDLFSTSQILDKELTKERMLDLSGYDFINGLSTSVLDQVSIDGGIYLLPVSNAMYGILYNKTLMEEKGWEVPQTFEELEALCADIRAQGLIPGILGTQLTGNVFSAVFNLAKTGWLTTPEGVNWERAFLSGDATAAGMWEGTLELVQKYVDMGMFATDPGDRSNTDLIEDYLAGRKAVFLTMAATMDSQTLSNGDQLGMMPYIGLEKNVYMYNPTSYIGINRELGEPGNEKKLEKALRVFSRLYSPEGQASFVTEATPCVMDVLNSTQVGEGSMIADLPRAMREGEAFRMTYAGWENVLSDMGQAFKEWIRGENGMDAAGAIARMDELQGTYLHNREASYFCQSTGDFTLEETAELVGKALGSSVGADAALIPYGTQVKEDGAKLREGVSGKLYQDAVNAEVSNTIAPGLDGQYALLTLDGASLKALLSQGFDKTGDGEPYPYALAMKGGGEPEDGQSYQVAFLQDSYTEDVGQAHNAQVHEGSIRAFLREWLTEQKTVSPGGNPWE